MLVLLLLLLVLAFNSPIFAVPTVTINSVPDVVTAGTTFPVSFTVEEASSSASYYYKFFGGVDTDVYKITNDSSLSYSSGWSNFPQITLDSTISNIFNSYAFVKSDVETGTLNLKIKLASTSNTKLGVTSPTFSIDVVAAPPPTDIPTSIPTSTPAPTSTKTPTPTPTKISTPTKIFTPTPSLIITPVIDSTVPTSTDTPILSPTQVPESESVLGANTVNKKNYFPLILICLGGLLLLAPLIIAKLKHEN